MTGTSRVVVWAEGIDADLKQRLPAQRKTQRDKLSLLVGTMLHVCSAKIMAGLSLQSDLQSQASRDRSCLINPQDPPFLLIVLVGDYLGIRPVRAAYPG